MIQAHAVVAAAAAAAVTQIAWPIQIQVARPEMPAPPGAVLSIKDVVSLGWSGEAIEMENLFQVIILRLVRQYKLGRKGRSSRPGPARTRL